MRTGSGNTCRDHGRPSQKSFRTGQHRLEALQTGFADYSATYSHIGERTVLRAGVIVPTRHVPGHADRQSLVISSAYASEASARLRTLDAEPGPSRTGARLRRAQRRRVYSGAPQARSHVDPHFRENLCRVSGPNGYIDAGSLADDDAGSLTENDAGVSELSMTHGLCCYRTCGHPFCN
jgi:hypothetical protein